MLKKISAFLSILFAGVILGFGANAELGMVSSVAGAASAAGTSFGTGMYVSGGVNFETTRGTNSSDITQSVASNVSGQNISFHSGNNMTQIGANVSATDTISYDIGNNLNMSAGTDTYRTESGNQTITAGASIGNNAVQFNAGYSESGNRASGTTHNNTSVTADNINITTGGDATFAGANVNADDKLVMDIGGNLTVESKQDTDYARGNNWGVNAGVGHGYGTNAQGQDMSGNRTGSAGFNIGSSNHDSAWTGDVTELTGGNVDINVGGKTTLTGAVIAANDGGELNLNTNELEYNDLHDFSTGNERGFGVGTNVGGAITDKGEFNMHPMGSTTVSATHTGSDVEQTTHATIGAGNVTVGGDTNPELAGLNRDTDNVQEITKDQVTGALDASVTVDNRIFSKSGQEQIAQQHEHFTDNAVMAAAGAYGTVEGAAKFVGDVVGLGDKEYDKNGNEIETSAIDKWKANQSGMATGIRRGGTDDAQQIIKAMSDGFVSPEDLQKLAAMTADGSVNLVYSNNQENVVFLDAAGNVIGVVARDGFNDLANNQGYVNLANGAGTDAYTFLRTDAEERAHNYVGASETAASAAANNEMSYYNAVAGLTGGYTVAPGQYGAGLGTSAQSQYNQQYNGATNNLLYINNVNASSVTGPTADSRAVLGAVSGAALGGTVGTVVPGVGNAVGAFGGAVIFGGLGLYEDFREYMNSGETWENMPEEMRADYSSKEAFQARSVVSLGLSRLENESEMLKSATIVPVDGPVYDPWTGAELPMSGFVYQVGNDQYYTAKQLSDAMDGNYNAQAWAWTEIGLTGASVAGGVIKGINALRYQPLYRAVGAEEATSIANTGKFTIPAGGAEGKWFTTSYQKASIAKTDLSSQYSVPYTNIIKTSVKKKDFNNMHQFIDHMPSGGVPTVYVPMDELNKLTNPKFIK